MDAGFQGTLLVAGVCSFGCIVQHYSVVLIIALLEKQEARVSGLRINYG